MSQITIEYTFYVPSFLNQDITSLEDHRLYMSHLYHFDSSKAS